MAIRRSFPHTSRSESAAKTETAVMAHLRRRGGWRERVRNRKMQTWRGNLAWKSRPEKAKSPPGRAKWGRPGQTARFIKGRADDSRKDERKGGPPPSAGFGCKRSIMPLRCRKTLAGDRRSMTALLFFLAEFVCCCYASFLSGNPSFSKKCLLLVGVCL